jgi:ribosomal protein S19
MNRIKSRGIYFPKILSKKLKRRNIWCRSAVIPFFLVDQIIFVHNGKEFRKVYVTREKVGFKFGDFSFTRKLSPKNQTKTKSPKKK